MAMSQELRSRLLEVVRTYRAEQKEEFGRAMLFEELEDEACKMGDDVAGALMAERLAEQALLAAARDKKACCPRCQRPAKEDAEPEPRLVQTRRGEVAWQEPTYYCRHCRQSFFPSVPHAGD